MSQRFKTTSRLTRRWSLIMMALILMAGCGAMASPTAATPSTSVTVQLAWVHTIEYAGLYMADHKGFYREENLEVIAQGFHDTSPIETVLAGNALFGMASADNLLVARASGKPVVAIATIYQRSPVAFISLKSHNIIRPQDLIGKKVLVHESGTTGIIYQALVKRQGIDPDQITTVARSDFSNTQLVNGEVDVMDAFINNQPIQLESAGLEVNAILASDYGIDMYANVIFTTQQVIDTQPELVTRFLRATLKGMQAVLDDPETATNLTIARNAELTFDAEYQSLLRALPLINPAGSQPGMMSDANWRNAGQVLTNQGLLAPGLDVRDAYTLSFLTDIYTR